MLKAISYTSWKNVESYERLVQQQMSLERWADGNGMDLTRSYTDLGCTETDMDLPSLSLLREFIEEHHLDVDLLLVVSPEQFAGNVKEVLKLLREICDRHQLEMICLGEATAK